MEIKQVTQRIFTVPRGTDSQAIERAFSEKFTEGPCVVILLNEGEAIEELTDERLARAGLMRIPQEPSMLTYVDD